MTPMEMFEQMLEVIGIDAALALQLSVATKFQEAVKTSEDAVITPPECAFMSVWIDSLVELKVSELLQTPDKHESNPFEVGRPGGYL